MSSVLISLALMLLAFELNQWFPRILRGLVELAVRNLPKKRRAAVREEWLAHLEECPGAILKLWNCSGFWTASRTMFPRWTRRLQHKRLLVRGRLASASAVRAIDLFLASLALLIFAPLFVIAAAAIAIEDRGPIFFVQRARGKSGKAIWLVRFRSMKCVQIGAAIDEEGEIGDPRVTGVGHVLRRTAIDELPMLINVVRGDLSLVGPKPAPEGLKKLMEGDPDWSARYYEHATFDKPGIFSPNYFDAVWKIANIGDNRHRPLVVITSYMKYLALAWLRIFLKPLGFTVDKQWKRHIARGQRELPKQAKVSDKGPQ